MPCIPSVRDIPVTSLYPRPRGHSYTQNTEKERKDKLVLLETDTHGLMAHLEEYCNDIIIIILYYHVCYVLLS